MMGAAAQGRCGGGWVVGAGLACIGRVLQLGRQSVRGTWRL